jgi:two-component system chemotaxis response regulator CheY
MNPSADNTSDANRERLALIADDEAHLRLYLKMILRELGFTAVEEAADGAQAIATAERVTPQLVLLDVNMTNTNGIEALRRIRELHPHVPIVMVTSMASRQLIEESIEFGASYYLRKDLPRDAIRDKLAEILKRFETAEA